MFVLTLIRSASRLSTLLVVLGILTVSAPIQGQVLSAEDDQTILTRLGLARYDVQELAIPVRPVSAFTISLKLDGEIVELDLAPYSVRSAGFRVRTRDARGQMHSFPLPAPTTYRGRLRQQAGSIAAASIINGQLRARIMDGDSVLVIQPLDEVLPNAEPNQYVLFHRIDEIALDFRCGTDLLPPRDRAVVGQKNFSVVSHCPSIAEIAFDADVEFFMLNGSDVTITVADIESIVNAMNVIYIRDVLIIHTITEIVVQTAEPDLLDSTDPGVLLNEFRTLWNTEHSPGSADPIARDIAHLMTGKNLNGSIIGNAFGGVICDNLSTGFGYGLSESLFSANFDRRVALTAHEVGHNWNALHCNSDPDCAVMCSSIGGCSTNVDLFGSTSITDITAFRNSSQCLSTLSPPLGPDCNFNCIEDFDDILIGISQDCTLNGVPDECDIANGSEFDCNLNGIPDSCEPDCNTNGIADECDISSGIELDCNLNAIPDSCEPDCNGNGIPDDCDVNVSYFADSGTLSPIDSSTDATFLFVAPPPRIGVVTFDFTASADLTTAIKSIEVFLNGLSLGEVFKFPGVACTIPPDFDQISMLRADFDAIVGLGDADILMTASLSDPLVCGPASFVTVTMSFSALSPFDLNGNGIIDSCECPADCAAVPDGSVNVTDLLALLANWGGSPTLCDMAPPGGDGTVNVTDLLALLAAWGSCP
ncbi:MAG: hypothetical protein IIB54_11935 [Planctomycetes bacterium]|nr:hypothetical protein [Planctomycetota bacterium]